MFTVGCNANKLNVLGKCLVQYSVVSMIEMDFGWKMRTIFLRRNKFLSNDSTLNPINLRKTSIIKRWMEKSPENLGSFVVVEVYGKFQPRIFCMFQEEDQCMYIFLLMAFIDVDVDVLIEIYRRRGFSLFFVMNWMRFFVSTENFIYPILLIPYQLPLLSGVQ